MNQNLNQAKHLLKFYFEQVYLRTGLHWNSNNDADIDAMVDSLVAAIRDDEHDQVMRDCDIHDIIGMPF